MWGNNFFVTGLADQKYERYHWLMIFCSWGPHAPLHTSVWTILIYTIKFKNLKNSNFLNIFLNLSMLTRTLYLSKTSCLFKTTPQFKAVCPPNVSRIPSGRSNDMTWKNYKFVFGFNNLLKWMILIPSKHEQVLCFIQCIGSTESCLL